MLQGSNMCGSTSHVKETTLTKKKSIPTRDGTLIKRARKSYVALLLDRSGSMYEGREKTLKAFNQYLAELQATRTDIDFSLVLFNSSGIDKLYTNEPVANVKPLTEKDYETDGCTPLVEAAIKTIRAVEAVDRIRVSKSRVVICIQTDGKENASGADYTMAGLAKLIKEKQKLGWEFLFMGCDIDAYEISEQMGISALNTMSYGGAHTDTAFAAAATNTAAYTSGVRATMAFTSGQKAAAGDQYDDTPPEPAITHVEARRRASSPQWQREQNRPRETVDDLTFAEE